MRGLALLALLLLAGPAAADPVPLWLGRAALVEAPHGTPQFWLWTPSPAEPCGQEINRPGGERGVSCLPFPAGARLHAAQWQTSVKAKPQIEALFLLRTCGGAILSKHHHNWWSDVGPSTVQLDAQAAYLKRLQDLQATRLQRPAPAPRPQPESQAFNLPEWLKMMAEAPEVPRPEPEPFEPSRAYTGQVAPTYGMYRPARPSTSLTAYLPGFLRSRYA